MELYYSPRKDEFSKLENEQEVVITTAEAKEIAERGAVERIPMNLAMIRVLMLNWDMDAVKAYYYG